VDDATTERLRRLSSRARLARLSWDEDAQSRNEAIYAAHVAGNGLREIARACDLAASHVQRIIDEQTAAEQQRAKELLP
jgi:Mor family transcriptional regulator